MAENITVLRVEISDSGRTTTNRDTSSTTVGTVAVGTSLGKTDMFDGKSKTDGFDEFYSEFKKQGYSPDMFSELSIGEGFIGGIKQGWKQRRIATQYFKKAKDVAGFTNTLDMVKWRSRISVGNLHNETSKKSYANAGQAALKSAPGLMKTGASAVAGGIALYSQYKSTGYNLSGATHAAQRQQRMASNAGLATGLGISVATGQYWATALLLANKAYTTSQQNRKEIYSIRSSQITSEIMRERLVENTTERRFN